MARQRIRPAIKARPRPLYPNGWPGNLRAALYLNSKEKGPSGFITGQPLQAETMMYGTTEMGNYG